jgi:hypothetical protein
MKWRSAGSFIHAMKKKSKYAIKILMAIYPNHSYLMKESKERAPPNAAKRRARSLTSLNSG